VLEPWRYEGPQYDKDFSPEERRRWERRFLD